MQSVSTNRVHASHPIQSTQVSATQTTNFAETGQGVSWWDAARFCNALSRRAGLTPVYHFRAEAEDIEWAIRLSMSTRTE